MNTILTFSLSSSAFGGGWTDADDFDVSLFPFFSDRCGDGCFLLPARLEVDDEEDPVTDEPGSPIVFLVGSNTDDVDSDCDCVGRKLSVLTVWSEGGVE